MTTYLRAEDLAARWAITTKTLANWRCTGTGPAFLKLGASVRYGLEDVVAYEKCARVAAVA